MLTLENITESDLRGPLKAKSLRRAKGYLGRVRNPVRCGQTLTAQVQGSRLYEVEVDVEPNGISARCSCPYDWGGYCKHVGALVLKWIRSPGVFIVEERQAVSEETPLAVTPVDPPPTRRPGELPPWLESSLDERRAADEEQLRQWLAEVPIQDLREMAEGRGWKAQGIRKDKVLRQVIEHLTDPDETLRAILDLDGEHRSMLCAVLLLGEERSAKQEQVERVASLWGPLETYKQLETYTRHLCEAGLAVPGNVVGGYPARGAIVPRAIARPLPPLLSPDMGLWPIPGHSRGSSMDESDDHRLADPYALIQSTNQVILLLEQSTPELRAPMPRPHLEKFHADLEKWDYVPEELARAKEHNLLHQRSGLVLTVPPPAYSLPNATIEHLAPVVGGEARLEFIYQMLVAVQVFQPGSPVTIWPEVKKEFLRRSPLAQRAILARAYFWSVGWSVLWDLLRQPPDSAQVGADLKLRRLFNHRYLTPQRLRSQLATIRVMIARALASLPDGEWIAMRDLYPLMQALWPHFNYPARQMYSWQSSGSWFLSEADSKQPLDSRSARQWQLGQGNFIRAMITGPLHWLGFADLSFDGDDVAAVRFHGLADLFWDRVDVPAPPPTVVRDQDKLDEGAVTFDQQAIIVRPSAIGGQAHDLLSKIARLETTDIDRFVYRLDPQIIHATFEDGAALSEILESWERWVPRPMPPAIRDQLTRWWEAYGQVRIYENVTVIEFGDEYALPEMKAITSLEDHIIAEPTPRMVIIPEESVQTLVAELEDAGHTPKQTSQV